MPKSKTSLWKSVPVRIRVIFLSGVFLIFTTAGFAGDILAMGRQPTLKFVLSVLAISIFAVVYAAAGTILREQWWKAIIPIFVVHLSFMTMLGNLFPNAPQLAQMGPDEIAQLEGRLKLNAISIVVAMALGYICFFYASVSEGRRYFRVHAEMMLAREIHGVLVPAIDSKTNEFEFVGRSLPSGEVGGDLIDVFQKDRGWIAYVADVSGHGVAPGIVMGMVKSAARMQLSSTEKTGALLEHLNSVLIPIKKPEMFVTFAYLAWDGERLQYSVAGHPPILHYHAATKDVSELTCSNLPLGMFAAKQFVSGTVECAPGDLFLMVTDGVLETANAKDEEFGIAGIKAVLAAQGGGPPGTTLQAVLDAASRFGHTADDQSLLLVKCNVNACA